MVSNQENVLVIFGLKREYNTLSSKKNLKKIFGFAKKSLENLKKTNLSKIDTVINIGYCGSIDPVIKSGEIIRVKNVLNESGKKIQCIGNNKNIIAEKINKLKLKELNMITTLKVKNLEEKINLKSKYSNVSLVDMEAFHLLQLLKKKNISFYSIKVVYDDLSFEIPNILQNFLNDDGELIFSKELLIIIFKNPKLLIQLFRMGKKYIICKKKLKFFNSKIFST